MSRFEAARCDRFLEIDVVVGQGWKSPSAVEGRDLIANRAPAETSAL